MQQRKQPAAVLRHHMPCSRISSATETQALLERVSPPRTAPGPVEDDSLRCCRASGVPRAATTTTGVNVAGGQGAHTDERVIPAIHVFLPVSQGPLSPKLRWALGSEAAGASRLHTYFGRRQCHLYEGHIYASMTTLRVIFLLPEAARGRHPWMALQTDEREFSDR